MGAKSATLVSLLAYAGPRREEALRLLAPLASDLKRWKLESGARDPKAPVIPAHDGCAWQLDDWRNWRRRTWGPYQRDRKTGRRRWVGVAPEGTRPRDLRSSFITLQIYAGVPLTTIARWCGTSVEMLDRHNAGVIANWDGVRVSPEQQIRDGGEALRPPGGRSVDVGGAASHDV
jgi:1-acyl-sn-glycerol-3-phosphate acyltransferase